MGLAVRTEPSRSMVASGETIKVAVEIEGAVDLGAFQFDLSYSYQSN